MTIIPVKNGVLVLCDGCEARWFEANDEPTAEQTVQELLVAGAEWSVIDIDPLDNQIHLCPLCSLDPSKALWFADIRQRLHRALTG